MRVIAGSARRISLEAPAGMDTRPTTDRIKETLFNIIQDDVRNARFLDLFSGSGGIGIEALSRGTTETVFVENDRRAQGCIRKNLEKTKLADRARLLTIDAVRAIDELGRQGECFDIIFADPPYRKGFEERILSALAASEVADENTLIIIELALDTGVDFVDERTFEIIRIKDYKTNRHIFLRKSNINQNKFSEAMK